MTFDDYNILSTIKGNITKLGYKKPTDIQYKAIWPILRGEDVLAIAQTGTGKTAAFAIPAIDMIESNRRVGRADGIKCIVMAPTRELVVQITEAFQQLSKNTRVKAFAVYGGVEQEPQIIKLEKGIDVLVATPGRMFDLVSQGYIKLNRINMLILDEADHMLDLGFYKDIQDLIKFLPKKRQTLFFSATINKKIKELAYSLVTKPIRIQVSPKDPVAKNIDHSVAFIEMDDKRFFLERMIKDQPDSKILVFVRTKIRAERICKAMERVGLHTNTIHGDKDQSEREISLAEFRNGKVKVLIATDVSARGIDIPNVEYVINYDFPDHPENYVHRIGRTGRANSKGIAVAFCSKDEREMLKEIEEYITKPVAVLDISKMDYIETLQTSSEVDDDWRSLMDNEIPFSKKKKKNRKKN